MPSGQARFWLLSFGATAVQHATRLEAVRPH